MFKILVADDEDLIRQGIIAILKRELDEDVCYLEAENGIEALKICKEHLPQLAITDIRMPFCDGLSLIKNVMATGHYPAFIILSGYADFDYAQSAIKLGVKEYILKPINKKELVTIVKGCVKTLTSEKQRMNQKLIRENENEKVAENMRQKLLVQLFACADANDAKRYVEELKGLGVFFEETLLMSALIEYRVSEGNKDYIDFAVKNIADEILSREANSDFVLTVQYDSGRIAAVFKDLKRESMLISAKQALTKVCSLIKKYLCIDAFAGVGDVVYGSTLLQKSFECAREIANYKIYDLGKSVQVYSEFPAIASKEPGDIGQVIRTIENINCTEIINFFEKLIKLPPSMQSLSIIENNYKKLINIVKEQMVRYNSSEAYAVPEPTPFHDIWNFLQLKQDIIRYLEHVQEFACKAQIAVPNKKLIVEILQYVKDNAASDINLNIVADKFNRTPAYMSAIFKKGTGTGFNEYITDIRMNMAKKMLTDTGIPIAEVGTLCGYSNPKYFSSVFKNTFGESPASYRQNSI